MSIGAIEQISPVKPPIVNTNINPTAKSIGVSNVMEPFHIVATQLKTLTPVGTEINMVAYMWCAHTMKDKIAIEDVAYTMDA
jgi:hypothetical protein